MVVKLKNFAESKNLEETAYQNLAYHIMTEGSERMDRTGVGTKALFGTRLEFSLKDGTFPLLTTKKMFTKAIIHELLWFLQGSDNIKYLKNNGVTIWDEWAKADGSVGPIYGYQWRKWRQYRETEEGVQVTFIDQINNVIQSIINNPASRRHLVSAWNPADIDLMGLPPCHYAFQFFCREISLLDRKIMFMGSKASLKHNGEIEEKHLDAARIPKNYLSCMFNMRSVDVALGLPFNIASYALLTHMIGQITNTVPEKLIFTGGDTHVYSNHIEGLTEQCKRDAFPFPKIVLNPDVQDIDEFMFYDFKIEGYESHPKIEFPIAV